MLADTPAELAERIRGGDIRAGARLMRRLDDERPDAIEVLKRLYPHTGRARIIGITGNPGSGKSTLTDRIIAAYRARGLTVGVVAVDPSSPYTGGAILGDRVRMQSHALDPGVFIRSLATRGHLGGLSRSTNDVVHVLDAMGFDVVLVETVGVGQDEVDIIRTAHTSIVVVVPGLGDDIQAIKAGILEIADLFVVNKSDLPGTERVLLNLKMMNTLRAASDGPAPEIVETVATRSEGIDALIEAVDRHRARLEADGTLDARLRARERQVLLQLLQDRAMTTLQHALDTHGTLERYIDALVERREDPWTLVERILARMLVEEERDR